VTLHAQWICRQCGQANHSLAGEPVCSNCGLEWNEDPAPKLVGSSSTKDPETALEAGKD